MEHVGEIPVQIVSSKACYLYRATEEGLYRSSSCHISGCERSMGHSDVLGPQVEQGLRHWRMRASALQALCAAVLSGQDLTKF